LGKNEALELAKTVEEIYSFKGKKVTHFVMSKDKPGDKELLEALLGPTGNLRAPSIKVGKKLIVGFNEEFFASNFKTVSAAAKSK
jgi:arsenate reductase-like glutaredoxin family protein